MPPQPKAPCELVRDFPFFAGLDEHTYAELLKQAQTRRYARGEPLFFEGEPCKGLFLVQSGVVKVYKMSESGREQVLTLQRPGDSVAELPLFDQGPYPASAVAMEDVTLLFIPRAQFHELLARCPQLCESVIKALAQRMRKLVSLVEDLSLRQVRQRVARLLLKESHGNKTFTLHYTNEELAAQLGSVRDVISRTLSGLQADGIISLHGRTVTITNSRELEEEAG